jgi:hypothetical protein
MKNKSILSNCLIRFNLRPEGLLTIAPRPIFTLILLAFTALVSMRVWAQEPEDTVVGQRGPVWFLAGVRSPTRMTSWPRVWRTTAIETFSITKL